MAVTTMIVIIVGILAATFLGVTSVAQWADVKKNTKQNTIFDFLKVPKQEESEDE